MKAEMKACAKSRDNGRIARLRARTRARGVIPVSVVLECAMVIGWFAFLIVGEKAVSSATDARRSAEDSAEESATGSSASHCTPTPASVGSAQAMPSIGQGTMPQAQPAVGVATALGVGNERTFPNYVLPMKTVNVTARGSDDSGKQFIGERGLGCTEKSLDQTKGSMDQYRHKIWVTNLQGY